MKTKRYISIGVCLLIMLTCILLAACDPVQPTEPKEGNKMYFVTNGGSKVDTIVAPAGAPITPPADPVKEGYFFVGWFLNKQATGAPESLPTVMPSKNVTYYAGWTDQGASVTLDPKGGTLDVTQFSAAVGAKLSELLRAHTPAVEDGIEFAGWYKNGTLIDSGATLEEGGVSLEARYRAYYTVNVYKEGLDGEDALDEAESINELVFVGTQRTYTYKTYEGYERTSDLENNSVALTVGMRPADNVINVYYDRLRVTVRILKGAESATGEESSYKTNFGAEFILPNNPFSFERHRFAGWRIGSGIFEEGASLSEEDLTVSDGNLIDVIAVWDERFDDIGGGVDILWALGKDNGRTVELVRENLDVMTGTLSDSGTFAIRLFSGTTLRGRVMRDVGLFTWDLGFGTHVARYVVDERGEGSMHPSDYAKLDDPSASELHIGGKVISGGYHFDNANGAYVFEGADGKKYYFSMLENNRYFTLREQLTSSYSYLDGDVDYEFIFEQNGAFELFRGLRQPYWLYKERITQGSYQLQGEDFRLSVPDVPKFDGKIVRAQEYGRSLLIYDASLDGAFAIEGGGSLRLDGFSDAVYTDAAGNEEHGEYYIVGADVVFFGILRSQHYARRGDVLVASGSPEIYRAYVTANGAESIVVNGHGKLRYVNSHGRVFYANYVEEDFDGDRYSLEFPIDSARLYFLLAEDVATPTGAEVGVYSRGGEKLYIDGLGGATYDDGSASYKCEYSLRSQEPFDYQLSGEAQFRFVLDGDNFKRRNDDLAGEFVEKFNSALTLFLDGYGAAELRKDGDVKTYSIQSDADDELQLVSADFGEERVRLSRGAAREGGTFVRYDESRVYEINLYDYSIFDEEGNNVDESKTLKTDGFDRLTLFDGDLETSGVIDGISEDNVYLVTLADGGSESIKLFAYPLAVTQTKWVYSVYEPDYDVERVSEDGTLKLDGYGNLTYTAADETVMRGFYSLWGAIVSVRGGDFDDFAYFNVSGKTFSRCTDVIVDDGIVKRFIGEGGHVDIPQEATRIGDGAFRRSGVQSVSAYRLDGGIADDAFEGCEQLERFEATTVSSVGNKAFYGCASLIVATGFGMATEVGDMAFAGCEMLERIDLSSARTIGSEAFAGTSAVVTLRDVSTIRDRAFAHGDGKAPQIEMTSWSASTGTLPAVEGDPFAFEGEGFDEFSISISQRIDLEKIYNDPVWSGFAGYVAFANVEPPQGEYFNVATLLKIKFGKISEFDGKRWTLFVPSETGGQSTLITYNGASANRVLELTISVDDENGELSLSDRDGMRYRFVSDGASLSFTAADEATLTLTVRDADVIPAVFNGRGVQLARGDMTFEFNNYVYFVELGADGTFAYKSSYKMQEVASYKNASDGGSEITLYKTNRDGTEYTLGGNYIVLDGGERYDFADITLSFSRIDERGAQFFVYHGTDCFIAEFALNDEDGTYTAVVQRRYTGKRYSMQNGAALTGEVIAYTEVDGQGVIVRVQMKIIYAGETYVVNAMLNGSNVTVQGDYPEAIIGTYKLQFFESLGSVAVDRA